MFACVDARVYIDTCLFALINAEHFVAAVVVHKLGCRQVFHQCLLHGGRAVYSCWRQEQVRTCYAMIV